MVGVVVRIRRFAKEIYAYARNIYTTLPYTATSRMSNSVKFFLHELKASDLAQLNLNVKVKVCLF